MKRRIFTKSPSRSNIRDRLLQMAQPGMDDQNHLTNGLRIQEAAFEVDPVAQVVVDMNNTVVLVNEQARALVGVTMKDIGRTLKDLEMSYRPVELRPLIEQAKNGRRPSGVKEFEWPDGVGLPRFVDVDVLPLVDFAGNPFGIKITFADVTRFKK